MSRETLRRDLDNAAGEAFLPEGWQRIVAHVGPLLAVADAADAIRVLWDADEYDSAQEARLMGALWSALAQLEALP